MSTAFHGRYSGEKSPLFWLYIKTACLTVLTLGIYRFWAKTRMRKYIWSSVNIGDDNLEYTGTGLEKFSLKVLLRAQLQQISDFFRRLSAHVRSRSTRQLEYCQRAL